MGRRKILWLMKFRRIARVQELARMEKILSRQDVDAAGVEIYLIVLIQCLSVDKAIRAIEK